MSSRYTLRATIAPRSTDRKSTRLNSSHGYISYAVFCLKKKNKRTNDKCLHATSRTKNTRHDSTPDAPASRLHTPHHKVDVVIPIVLFFLFFFFNDTATTEIYTLSLHDALPISALLITLVVGFAVGALNFLPEGPRSEEHTSELQSRLHLVCRLLLEKKKKTTRRAGVSYLRDVHGAVHYAVTGS